MSLSTLNSNLTILTRRLQYTIAQSKMSPILKTFISYLFTFRTLFFILALFNLKSLPLSWHIRLFRNMARHSATVVSIQKRLGSAASCIPTSPSSPKPIHPLFRPVTLSTHVPLAECDYNGHKSNSTYFSDLDLSRGNLMTSLIGPAMSANVLVPHGIRPGLCYPILGSVHTSFLREIKPYERYDVRSRVLGWDRKWIVIFSVFARKATKEEIQKDQKTQKDFLKRFGELGDHEVVFAVVLNKYVIKAGRMTVPPELCFAGSGWFPVRPEATETIRRYNNSSSTTTTSKSISAASNTITPPPTTGTATPSIGPDQNVEDAANKVHSVALEAGRRLSMSADRSDILSKLKSNSKPGDSADMPGWSWDEIEAERLRGLKIAEDWLALDVGLRKEYESDVERRIW